MDEFEAAAARRISVLADELADSTFRPRPGVRGVVVLGARAIEQRQDFWIVSCALVAL